MLAEGSASTENLAAEKARIEAFAHEFIAPHLPQLCPTRLEYFGGMPAEGKEYTMAAEILLIDIMRAVINFVRANANLTCQQLLGFQALLVERFSLGNCGEQATYAAVKLVDHPDVKEVYQIHDKGKDHCYVLLRTNCGVEYIYDPWLTPHYLIAPAEFQSLIESFTPEKSEICIEPIKKAASDFYTAGADAVALPENLLERHMSELAAGKIAKRYLSFLVAKEEKTRWNLETEDSAKICTLASGILQTALHRHSVSFLGMELLRWYSLGPKKSASGFVGAFFQSACSNPLPESTQAPKTPGYGACEVSVRM